jgi:hypothetical protein
MGGAMRWRMRQSKLRQPETAMLTPGAVSRPCGAGLRVACGVLVFAAVLAVLPVAAAEDAKPAPAAGAYTLTGTVFDDRDGDGRQDRGEAGIAGVGVSNGRALVRTDAAGRYRLPVMPGQTVFAIKPAGWRLPGNDPARPTFWVQIPPPAKTALRYGGLATGPAPRRFDLGLLRAPAAADAALDVLVFGDPQVKSEADVGHYGRDIIDAVLADRAAGTLPPATLGLSLGDIADDVLSLYPALNAQTRRLGVPWLHAPGNHDLDFDAADDAGSLDTFRNTFGPDSFAWEEPQATFVVLDDVIYRPGQTPKYIGGLREDQFAFLEAYLPTLPKERLLVIALHIPLFEPPGRDTFRDHDRARLFALLQNFPQVLVLSAHSHVQQHVHHGEASGWRGVRPLHEYNVGAACGAFWSGAPDARGVPDATMADGTPNGYALLRVRPAGGDASDAYSLRWRVAGADPRDAAAHTLHLHAPKALRQGAYPAWAVYANVYMTLPDTRVDYRIDGGDWQPMTRSARPDPRLLAENARDDAAAALRGFDRSPEAEVSSHLWRGALRTDLALGVHRVEVRVRDAWVGEVIAATEYRLLPAP